MTHDLNGLSMRELRLWCASYLGSDRFYSLDSKMFILLDAHFTGDQGFSFKCSGDSGWTCIKGTCRGTINGTAFELHPRSTLISLQDSLINIERSSPDFMFHATYMTREFAQTIQIFNPFSLTINVRDIPVYRLSAKQFSINLKYLDLMVDSIQDEDNPYREQILYRLQEAQYFTILRHLRQNKEKRNADLSRADDLATRFNTLLELEYMHHHDVAFYADRLCVTPKSLSANIKRLSGETAGQWIDKMVILAARHLLGNSSLSIKDISYALGFDDPSAFGKYFKRLVGTNPRNYRVRLK